MPRNDEKAALSRGARRRARYREIAAVLWDERVRCPYPPLVYDMTSKSSPSATQIQLAPTTPPATGLYTKQNMIPALPTDRRRSSECCGARRDERRERSLSLEVKTRPAARRRRGPAAVVNASAVA